MTFALAQTPFPVPNSAPPEAIRQREWVLSLAPTDLCTGWEDVIIPQAAAELATAIGQQELAAWALNWAKHHLAIGDISGEGPIKSNLNPIYEQTQGLRIDDYCGNWGIVLVLHALNARPEIDFSHEIQALTDRILTNCKRADDGTILHGGKFTNNIWVDTLYYTAPIFAACYQATGVIGYLDEAIAQCRLHAKHLRNQRTGLYHHDADPRTAVRTAGYWARGNGWIILSLADTLAICPTNHQDYAELLALYRDLAESLLTYQHPCGLWRTQPENELSHLETSGTAMILTGLTKGLNAGWIEPYIAAEIKRGYAELLRWLGWEGRVHGSQHPAGRGAWDLFKFADFGVDSYTDGFTLRLQAQLAILNAESLP